MFYSILKIMHVIAASLLLGTGLLSSIYMTAGWLSQNKNALQNILSTTLKLNLYIIAPAGFFQVITGFYLISLKPHEFTSIWIALSFITFAGATLCWLLGMYCLNSLAHHLESNHPYKRTMYLWAILSAIGIFLLFTLMWLMSTHAITR